MAKPLTQEERDEIIDLLPTGKSAREIAAHTGRSVDTVSRLARSVGHAFGQTNLARAHEARSAYSAERRAESAARAQELADKLLGKASGKYLVFNFGGRDNDYNEHELEEPPVEALRQIAASYRDLMRTVLDVDRHDNRNDENLSAVDEWLRTIVGEAAA
jgi:hypothetical protein